MNPEQERYRREGLQPPEYEPPLDPKFYGHRAPSTAFWWVVGATLAIVGVAALGIWWLAS